MQPVGFNLLMGRRYQRCKDIPLKLITDMHMSLPMNIRPVEAFEISVCETEE
jgi:hypothetical protein